MTVDLVLAAETLIQFLAVVLLSPFFIGISNKLKGRVESRIGPAFSNHITIS